MVAGMLLYVINYLVGRTRNSALAQAWCALPRPLPRPLHALTCRQPCRLDKHRQLLQDNFALVGQLDIPTAPLNAHSAPPPPLPQETLARVASPQSASSFQRVTTSFVFGPRAGSIAVACWPRSRHAMPAPPPSCNWPRPLQLKKRHDLLSLLYSIVKPQTDTVVSPAHFLFTARPLIHRVPSSDAGGTAWGRGGGASRSRCREEEGSAKDGKGIPGPRQFFPPSIHPPLPSFPPSLPPSLLEPVLCPSSLGGQAGPGRCLLCYV